MKKIMAMLLPAVVLAVCSSQLHALPIIYSWSVTGAGGSLGGVAFSNASLVVDIVGDTDDVEAGTFNRYFNRALSGSFALDGIGSGIFTIPLNVYKASSSIGFNAGGADFLYLIGSFDYFLETEFGPVIGAAGEQDVSIMTDLGAFALTSVGSGAFEARFPQDPTPVPAPAPLLLILAGLGALMLSTFKRRAKC